MDFIEEIYLAYIDDFLFAVSSKKKRIKLYMEEVHHCNKGKYTIENRQINDDNWRTVYEDYILTKFNDIWLTPRDILIIDKDRKELETLIENTYKGMRAINSLFEASDMINEFSNGLGKKITSQMSTTADNISTFISKDKYYNALQRTILLSSVVFTRNIDIYCRRIKQEEEIRRLNTEFIDKLKDDSV